METRQENIDRCTKGHKKILRKKQEKNERKCMQILKERERKIVKKYFVNDDTR